MHVEHFRFQIPQSKSCRMVRKPQKIRDMRRKYVNQNTYFKFRFQISGRILDFRIQKNVENVQNSEFQSDLELGGDPK